MERYERETVKSLGSGRGYHQATLLELRAVACAHLSYACSLKADLDDATFAYDRRMRFLERALLASCKKIVHSSRHLTLPLPTILTFYCF